MAKKKDPSITFLNEWGYNVVKLPRGGIEPLDVIGRDHGMQWLGPLNVIWTSTSPAPLPGPSRPASTINGRKTDAFDLSLGLSVLANALAAFGATVPSLDVAYKEASRVQFSYSGVAISMISPLDAGNYLAAGELRTDNPVVRNYFQNPKCKAYLITSVLKSASIVVSATDQHGSEIGLDIPAISGMVGASVKVKPSNTSNSSITFTGPEAVTFGFMVQQISYADGAWSLQHALASGHLAFGVSDVQGRSTSRGKGVIFEDDDIECRIDLGFLNNAPTTY